MRMGEKAAANRVALVRVGSHVCGGASAGLGLCSRGLLGLTEEAQGRAGGGGCGLVLDRVGTQGGGEGCGG